MDDNKRFAEYKGKVIAIASQAVMDDRIMVSHPVRIPARHFAIVPTKCPNMFTGRNDHLPLKKFLRKMTLNNMVNNWSTEIESFNINFVHISGKANVLADMLSRLIDTDPDLQQQPELEGHEFRKYCFETLPKVRGSISEVKNRW